VIIIVVSRQFQVLDGKESWLKWIDLTLQYAANDYRWQYAEIDFLDDGIYGCSPHRRNKTKVTRMTVNYARV
jgi:hypothetical protein